MHKDDIKRSKENPENLMFTLIELLNGHNNYFVFKGTKPELFGSTVTIDDLKNYYTGEILYIDRGLGDVAKINWDDYEMVDLEIEVKI